MSGSSISSVFYSKQLKNLTGIRSIFYDSTLCGNLLYFNFIRMSFQWQIYFPRYCSVFVFLLNRLNIFSEIMVCSCVEISLYEAIIFNLHSIYADSFPEQHSSDVFFVGKQLVYRFTVPLSLALGSEDSLLLQFDRFYPNCHQQDIVQISSIPPLFRLDLPQLSARTD